MGIRYPDDVMLLKGTTAGMREEEEEDEGEWGGEGGTRGEEIQSNTKECKGKKQQQTCWA